MALSRAKKEDQLKQIKDILNNSVSFVVVDFQGILAQEIVSIRRKLSSENVNYLVAKKTLIKRAILDIKKDMNIDFVSGSGALVASDDVVLLTKAISGLNKNYPALVMNYGFDLTGAFYDQTKLMTLSKLPSRQEQVAQLAGLLASPLSGLARVLNSNIGQLASILDALSKNVKAN